MRSTPDLGCERRIIANDLIADYDAVSFLEGQDDDHVIDDFGDLLHPAAAPRPELR